MSDLVSRLRSHMDHMGHSECEASADRIAELEGEIVQGDKAWKVIVAEARRARDSYLREWEATVARADHAEAALGEAREVLTAVLEMDPGDFHWHRFKAHPEKYAYGSYAGMKGDPRSCSCEYDKAVRFLSGAPSSTAPADSACIGCGGNGEANSTSPMYQYNIGGRCTYCGGSGLQRDFIPMSRSGGLRCPQP